MAAPRRAVSADDDSPVAGRANSTPRHEHEEVGSGFRFGAAADSQYEIANLLGHGTFAKVFKCTCSQTKEIYAVKVVSLKRLRFMPDFELQAQMMEREVEILRTLRHERICNMHDFCQTDEHWFLVMELVCHGELFHNIPPNKGMRELEAKYVFHQLLESIGYIHSKGVMHRDLKPENILIVRSQQAPAAAGPKVRFHDIKIADFGLSKVRDGEAAMAQSCVGSPVYAAPEIFSEKGYTQSVDTWSLGAVLFVMLCGVYPFDGRTMPRDITLGSLSQVSGCLGPSGVEMIQLVSRDGEVRSYSSSDAPVLGPWVLDSAERVLAVTQEEGQKGEGALGRAMAFLTSKGNVFSFDGPSAGCHARFAAPPGSQIVGLEFDGSRLVGIRTAKGSKNTPGAIAQITGWSGTALDGAELALRDGTKEHYGGDGGFPKGPWKLAEMEKIWAVTQEQADQYLSKSIAFFTTEGNIIALEGTSARRVNRFTAPAGSQIDRLKFEPDGRLSGALFAAEDSQLCCANFKMDTKRWEAASPDAQRIVRGLLRVDISKRLLLQDCLNEHWLHDPLLPYHLEEDFGTFIKRGSKGDLISKAAEDAAIPVSANNSEPGSRSNSALSIFRSTGEDREVPTPTQSPTGSCPVVNIMQNGVAAGSSPTSLAEAPDFGGAAQMDVVYGAVQQIRGKVCSAVDRVELQMWKGHTLCYGGHGGGPVGPWKLKPEEFIVAVEQEFREEDLGYLGNELAFFTSFGRVFTLTGSYAKRVHRFAAKRGNEITGLNFEGSRMTGVRTQSICGREGCVSQISGRLADCLDQVVLTLRGGSVETYGAPGGRSLGPFHLHPQERIIAVSQEHHDLYLGMGIAFFTSMGNVIAFDGRKAGRRNRYAAGAGQQIFGLHFEGSRLVEVLARPHSMRPRGASKDPSGRF